MPGHSPLNQSQALAQDVTRDAALGVALPITLSEFWSTVDTRVEIVFTDYNEMYVCVCHSYSFTLSSGKHRYHQPLFVF